MALKELIKKYWIILVIVLLIIFLYPKNAGYTYGGLVMKGSVLYREEYSCLGIKYQMRGGPFFSEQCADCGKNVYCVGIPLSKTCYNWTADGTQDLSSERKTECKIR